MVKAFTQGSSSRLRCTTARPVVATLGWMIESRWDSSPEFPKGIRLKLQVYRLRLGAAGIGWQKSPVIFMAKTAMLGADSLVFCKTLMNKRT